MAKRGKSLNPGYRSGSHWADCWSCGFAFRSEDLRETWDGRWVCDEDWERRHEQDFLRVTKEQISVSQPILLDTTDNILAAGTLGPVTWTAPTFGHTSGVAGEAEAGRGIAGKASEIPTPTFNAQKLDPSLT